MFAQANVPLVGPETDAGAMAWLLWGYVDFPLGLLALTLASNATSNAAATVILAAVGGLQWVIWWLVGAHLYLVIKRD